MVERRARITPAKFKQVRGEQVHLVTPYMPPEYTHHQRITLIAAVAAALPSVLVICGAIAWLLSHH